MNKEMLYEKFMRESNQIEGEFDYATFGPVDGPQKHIKIGGDLHPNDMKAIDGWMSFGAINEERLLRLHYMLSEHRDMQFKGEYRKCDVRIGSKLCPSYRDVPQMMKFFWENFMDLNSWDAHNLFEYIHPFEDLNGRTGRLLWLWKAVNQEKSYNFDYPFLQAYYYQTLNYSNDLSKSYISHKTPIHIKHS